MSIPRSNNRSSTLRRLSGKRTYIITTSRITSADELKYLNGFADLVIQPVYPHHDPAAICSDNTGTANHV